MYICTYLPDCISSILFHKARKVSTQTLILYVCELFFQTLEDIRFKVMSEKINSVLHDDTHYEKGALNMRTQRCFAIRSGMNGMLKAVNYNTCSRYVRIIHVGQ